jgi:hypothetical protein
MKRKQPLTLLEVIIALSLTSIVLFFLFGFYRDITLGNVEAEKMQEKFFAREKVQMRLMQLFSDLLPEGEPRAFFYTESAQDGRGMKLFASFNNGMDSDSLFSGAVSGELFLASNKNLELHFFPIREEKKERVEVLLENVHKISFKFFDIEKKIWKDQWEKKSASFPAMIEIFIEQEKHEPLKFAFFLPAAQSPVVFR